MIKGRLPALLASALVFACAPAISPATAPTLALDLPNRSGKTGKPENFLSPWEGARVYYFGGLLIDLNHGVERWVPERLTPLIDCSTEELFCLEARGSLNRGVVALVAPRWCSDFQVGDSWSVGELRTSVLARIEQEYPPIRDPADLHRWRPRLLLYLGDPSNPRIVYEYMGGGGVVAIWHGLSTHSNLVEEVRSGLDPRTLPSQYRFELNTLDRFANCRWRDDGVENSRLEQF